MLYELKKESTGYLALEPLEFHDFAALGLLERDLETLLNDHLLDILFEDAPLMPIFRERSQQPEADLYALDASGNLAVFELKRSVAGGDAVLQVLRYAQAAGRWSYSDLQHRYNTYCGNPGVAPADISAAHKDAFKLAEPLSPDQFNLRQQLWVIGSAADDDLISAVGYWKAKGIPIGFVPYRVYKVGESRYFEMFSFPYDRHRNPGHVKGVLFDTNNSWNAESVWEMIDKERVAAYGAAKRFVDYLDIKDIVFLSQRGVGIVAAARVTGSARDDGPEERYRQVEFLTPPPTRAEGFAHALSFGEVSQVMGKPFYWAATIKKPSLTRVEADRLLAALKEKW